MPAAKPMVAISVTVSQKDLDRVEKRLDKWQGKPLEVRLKKATEGSMSLMVNPIRAQTPVSEKGQKGRYAHQPGNLRRKVRQRVLKKRQGEVAAAYAGPSVYYGQWAQHGSSMGQQPNEFVGRALAFNRERISSFIDEQVRRLA